MEKAKILETLERLSDLYEDEMEQSRRNSAEHSEEEYYGAEDFDDITYPGYSEIHSYNIDEVPKHSNRDPWMEIDEMNESTDELMRIEKIFKEYSNIPDPYERIIKILDRFEEEGFPQSNGILWELLDFLPSNDRTQIICTRYLSNFNSYPENAEEIGRLFKYCGETLEDVPIECFDRFFLEGYIKATKSNDPNIREQSYQDIPRKFGEIIEAVKGDFSREHNSLSTIKNITSQNQERE